MNGHVVLDPPRRVRYPAPMTIDVPGFGPLPAFVPIGGGPPIVSTPALELGKPISAWDLIGAAMNGRPPRPEHHYMPMNIGAPGFSELSSTVLDAQYRQRAVHPLRFTLKEARRIKLDYWLGLRTIAEMARDFEATTVTIGRIVHAKTYWWA